MREEFPAQAATPTPRRRNPAKLHAFARSGTLLGRHPRAVSPKTMSLQEVRSDGGPVSREEIWRIRPTSPSPPRRPHSSHADEALTSFCFCEKIAKRDDVLACRARSRRSTQSDRQERVQTTADREARAQHCPKVISHQHQCRRLSALRRTALHRAGRVGRLLGGFFPRLPLRARLRIVECRDGCPPRREQSQRDERHDRDIRRQPRPPTAKPRVGTHFADFFGASRSSAAALIAVTPVSSDSAGSGKYSGECSEGGSTPNSLKRFIRAGEIVPT